MWIKGVKCRRSYRYGWRQGNPETDVDASGNPVERNYITLVRIKDCPIRVEDGRRYYQPKGIPQAVKLLHGGTYYGYGKTRKAPWYASGCTHTTAFYAVRDGIVYQGTIRYNELDS